MGRDGAGGEGEAGGGERGLMTEGYGDGGDGELPRATRTGGVVGSIEDGGVFEFSLKLQQLSTHGCVMKEIRGPWNGWGRKMLRQVMPKEYWRLRESGGRRRPVARGVCGLQL